VGEFGDKFRKAREKKGISLEDVSNVTKISSRNLKAIEEEHFDQLPGGVFNKGFIRAYAKHVGLNDEQAVNEYLACQRQAQIDAQALYEPKVPAAPEKRPPVAAIRAAQAKAANPALPATNSPAGVEELPNLQLPRAEHVRPAKREYLQRRDGGIPWRLVAAAVVVLVLGFILWQRHGREAHGSAASAAPSGSPMSVAAATPVPSSLAPVAITKEQKVQPATSVPKSSSLAVTPAASTAKITGGDEGAAGTTSNKAAVAPAAATLTLVIRATENSWVSVAADGQVVSQETLIAPAHTSVRASREIVAKVGNAAGVSFLWNGEEIPPAGQESEVKTFVFDAAGMRVVPAGQPPSQTQ